MWWKRNQGAQPAVHLGSKFQSDLRDEPDFLEKKKSARYNLSALPSCYELSCQNWNLHIFPSSSFCAISPNEHGFFPTITFYNLDIHSKFILLFPTANIYNMTDYQVDWITPCRLQDRDPCANTVVYRQLCFRKNKIPNPSFTNNVTMKCSKSALEQQ